MGASSQQCALPFSPLGEDLSGVQITIYQDGFQCTPVRSSVSEEVWPAEEYARNKMRRWQMSYYGNPYRDHMKEEEEEGQVMTKT